MLYLQHCPVFVSFTIYPSHCSAKWWSQNSVQCHLVTTVGNCRNAHVLPGTALLSQEKTLSEGKCSFPSVINRAAKSCIHLHTFNHYTSRILKGNLRAN